ncbi:type IV pilus assembly protein PilM [Neobacillus niacini]|uniref:type IV pilus biogenesis protein PilM n=1 Tax=Neobacillus niacini TaxID=86668 RepID=UPI00286626F1|nr:pilus assembly protein PilM [Neobacillus niacini]MDR7077919.1 type IV pilus assembly protein PilM [Neobacillus niacini]
MAFSLFSSKNRIVNLVLNDHSVRFVELKQANPPAAQKWCERFLPPGVITDGKITDSDTLANILEECIDEWKIKGRQVRFIVPDPLVIIRKVSIPADIQEDEIKGYLYLELGSSIHLPFEEPVFDYFPLADNGKTRELLLFAAPEQNVMEYAEVFSSLKLTPIAAEISPLALYRLYYQLGQSKEKEVLFTVQFDLTSVNLCIFEETVPLVMRQFPLPFDIEKWEIKQDTAGRMVFKFTGETDELVMQFEDILNEINKLVDFYRYTLSNEKRDVTKFLLNGDHPMLTAIYEEMEERFDIPVEMIELESDEKGKTGSVPANLLLSLGLALKEVK